MLEDLDATGNGDAAVWVGEGELSLSGAATHFADNAFASIVAVDANDVSVSDARIEGTRESLRAVGGIGAIRIGDGIHLMGSTSGLFERCDLVANERAGIVLDLAGEAVGPTFTGVTVDSTADGLGAIAGSLDASGRLAPVATGAWDTGIERRGAAAANDPVFAAALDAVGVGAAAPGEVPNPTDRVGAIAPMF